MTRIVSLYVIFSAAIVSLLYTGSIFFPSVLFNYPRTFGEDLSNKIFSVSLLSIITVLSILFLISLIKVDRRYLALKLLGENSNAFHTSLISLCVLFSAVPFLIATFILLRYPSSADEVVYLFQARLFADGALFAAAPPVPQIFATATMVEHGGKWVSQFPPGWPAVIAAGTILGLPDWTVNPVLGIVSVALVYYLCFLQYSRSTAVAISIVYATSIFFIFNAASFFSHVSFVVFALCYSILVVLFSKTQKGLYLVGAGIALSAALTVRYYPAVLMGIPLVFYLYKWRALPKGIACMALGGLPITVTLAAYHTVVFGSPLKTGYSFMPDYAAASLGIDILAGIHSSLISLWELGGWASPTLMLMYLVAMVYRIRSGSLAFTDTLFLAVLLGHCLFWQPGALRYGPRYLFDAFPFFAVCAVAGVFDFVRDKSDVMRNGARHAVIMTVVYSLCVLPFVAVFFHKATWERAELERLIEAKGIRNAIVIVRSGTGRLLPYDNKQLVRNDPYLTNDVLFVLPTDQDVLTTLFPSRSLWAYERTRDGTSPGDLVRIW